MTVLYWLCYNFVLALLPVPIVAFYMWLSNTPVSLVRIVRDGQLFFYSAAVAAAAIGDFLMPRHELAVSQIGLGLCVFSLLLCVILSCWFFGISTGAGAINDRRLASISYIFTIGSTILVVSMRWSLDLL